jgi:hypothetical protein
VVAFLVPAVTGDAADTIMTNAATLLPQLTIVAGAAIAVGVGVLIFRRGWSLFRGLAK